MKFYNFDEINSVADCRDIAKALFSVPIDKNDRGPAVWRGGDNPTAVHFETSKWYDHVQKEGGGPLELAAKAFDGNIQTAQNWVGEYYGLTPAMGLVKHLPGECRYGDLLEEGYKETGRWEYRDLDDKLIHFTVRMDHPGGQKGKEFCQGHPDGWGVKNIDLILYNLKEITVSDWVCIVEGEKCADSLIQLDLPATTCAGGSKKWKTEYSRVLSGKSIAILPDNDEPGEAHAKSVALSLLDFCKDVRIVPTSTSPKGDVVDWLDSEGGSKDALLQKIRSTRTLKPEDLQDAEEIDELAPLIAEAKKANAVDFRNFVPSEVEVIKRGKATTEEVKTPRHITDMVEDIHRRFLKFPKKIGSLMFDHDRDTDEIRHFYRTSELFAWIDTKSKKQTAWARGDSFKTKEEFMAGLHAAAQRFEGVSTVPDYPKRGDIYYKHAPLPPPCPDCSRFETFVNFFNPDGPEHRILMKAMFTAPIWYIRGIPRPLWIVDSPTGQGSGKTIMVGLLAYLYGGEMFDIKADDFKLGYQDLVKRLVSASGRERRILCVDNATGRFKSPELASLITARSITGKAPYGRGEEARPNNLTYIITVNSADVDMDLASRAFFVHVVASNPTFKWTASVQNYVDAHRLEILSDVISRLRNHTLFPGIAPKTRFPEFEGAILQAWCDTPEEFAAVLETIHSQRIESNSEEDMARDIEDQFKHNIRSVGLDPDSQAIFIRSQVVDRWVLDCIERHQVVGTPTQMVRNFGKLRLIKQVHPKTKIFPFNGPGRRRGIMWNWVQGVPVTTILRAGDGTIQKSFLQD